MNSAYGYKYNNGNVILINTLKLHIIVDYEYYKNSRIMGWCPIFFN